MSENHLYPSLGGDIEDDTSHARNIAQIHMSKGKISQEIVRGLMKRTFNRRRKMMDDPPVGVKDILEEYPVFTQPSFVRILEYQCTCASVFLTIGYI